EDRGAVRAGSLLGSGRGRRDAFDLVGVFVVVDQVGAIDAGGQLTAPQFTDIQVELEVDARGLHLAAVDVLGPIGLYRRSHAAGVGEGEAALQRGVSRVAAVGRRPAREHGRKHV